MYKKINTDNNFDKIVELEKILKRQFALIEEKNNLTKYYNQLKNYFYDTVMDDDKGMTLDQVYIEPSFSIIHNAFKNDDVRILKSRKEKFFSSDPRYSIHEFIEETLNQENPLELKKAHRLVLLLGYPGQGKSSFCKKFLNDYIIKGKTEKKALYYFQLRNIRQVKEFINNPITVLHDQACIYSEQELDRFEFYKSLLVLDGLDELYMKENLKLDDIDKLCVELAKALEIHKEMQIILTSRYGYVDDEKLTKENILIIQIAVFPLDLQIKWLNNFTLFHPETWLTHEKLAVLNREHNYKHIKELLVQPLLLHMIASIKSEVDHNTNRAKIYNQLFNELIERKYSRDGQLEIFKNITEEILRILIREIAFCIFQSGNEYITKTDLIKLTATKSFLNELTEISFRDSIKGIMISFYFKEVEKLKDDESEDKSNYAIEFLHKSLREYMTAEKILESLKDKFLEKTTKNRYVIDEAKKGLEIINEIFGKQTISEEIREHLNEIINNSNDLNKSELADRLCFFLPDFVSTDFIIEYRIGDSIKCIDYSLNNFYGFWNFISCLRPQKNYFTTSEVRERVSRYLRLLSSSEDYSLMNLDFSYQCFDFESLSKVDFYLCKFDNTSFTNCDLTRIEFNDCIIENCDFEDTYLGSSLFEDSFVHNCSFEESSFHNVKIVDTLFENINFNEANISSISYNTYFSEEDAIKDNFEGSTFNNAVIDTKSLEFFNHYYPKINNQSFKKMEEEEHRVNNSKVLEELTDIPENYKRIIVTPM